MRKFLKIKVVNLKLISGKLHAGKDVGKYNDLKLKSIDSTCSFFAVHCDSVQSLNLVSIFIYVDDTNDSITKLTAQTK